VCFGRELTRGCVPMYLLPLASQGVNFVSLDSAFYGVLVSCCGASCASYTLLSLLVGDGGSGLGECRGR